MTMTYAPVVSTLVDTRPASGAARFHLTMAAVAIGLAALDLVLAARVELHGMRPLVMKELYGICLLGLAWGYARWARRERFLRVVEMTAWALVLLSVFSVLTQIAGRSAAPLVDAKLARIDGFFGWNTARVVAAVNKAPVALRIASLLVYQSILPLLIASLAKPGMTGRWRDTARYLIALTIASLLTASLFVFLPAVGPWTVYGYRPGPDQVAAQEYLRALKTPGPLAMGIENCGVVSFPSFHTVLALLSAAALWRTRIRWVAVALAVLICISTVTTGWHYGIDVLGGVAVALVSQSVARKLC